MKGYPRWFLPGLLITLLLVLVSGALLIPTTLVMRLEMALAWRLPGDARILTAAAHAAAGFAAMMLLGSLWSVHMRAGWRRRRHRISGSLTGVLLLLLAVSAVGVYYLGEETAGVAAALVHIGLGLVLLAPFGWHWVVGRRSRHHSATLHAVGAQHDAPSRRHSGGRH
jgi:uncharacterized membrane protein